MREADYTVLGSGQGAQNNEFDPCTGLQGTRRLLNKAETFVSD